MRIEDITIEVHELTPATTPKLIPLTVGQVAPSMEAFAVFISPNADLVFKAAGRLVLLKITDLVDTIVPELTGYTGGEIDG